MGSQEGPGRSCHPPRVFPAAQPSQGVQELALPPLHLPRVQLRQELRPVLGLYLPEAQGAQSPWPFSRSPSPPWEVPTTPTLYLPRAQSVQTEDPCPLYMPAAQGSHCPSPLSNGVEPDCGLLYLPASQGVQALARAPLYMPAAQGSHCPSPLSNGVEPDCRLLYLPAAQSVQELARAPLYSPGSQGSHEVLELYPPLALPAAPAQAKSAMSPIGRGRQGGRFGKEGRSASAIRANAI